MDDSVLAKVEAQRLELEDNIAKLRKSLRHWQTLELDYEGLKEEFQLLPEDASREKCLEAGLGFNAVLVNEKDLEDLLKDTKTSTRRPEQLANILSRRVDYVSRNAETARKQLSDAEKKRNALLLAEDPEYRDSAGLPLVEVTEELDDSGRVIASKVQKPTEAAPQLIEVLQKAGIEGLESEQGKHKAIGETSSEQATVGSTANQSLRSEDDVSESDEDIDQLAVSSNRGALTPVSGQSKSSTNTNDTPEDAALRREMLDYGLDEVGAIVAELDMEEAGSDVSYDEEGDNLEIDSDFDEDYEYNESDEDSEDETGKTKNLKLSTRYKRRMEELQKKLGAENIINLGPNPKLPSEVKDQLDHLTPAEAARKAAIARAEAAQNNSEADGQQADKAPDENKPKKKKVSFAQSVDIAERPKKSQRTSQSASINEVNPVAETVIERADSTANTESVTATTTKPAPAPGPPVKVSRFKAAKQTAQQPSATDLSLAPSGRSAVQPQPSLPLGPPTDKVIVDQLVERPHPPSITSSSSSHSQAPPGPDDFDEEIHRREVATEYYKMRNRKIHEQGGFVGDGEEDNYGEELAPTNLIVDPDTGKTRKISRFKAARLKG